jgi:hypothetical protein
MAADTAEKRFSAMQMGLPWRGVNVTPSTVDQDERQAVMFWYSGILFASAGGTQPVWFQTQPWVIGVGLC